MLINALVQAKSIGDKKMELSQQMLDAAERQSRKLQIACQNNSNFDQLTLHLSIKLLLS